MTPNANQGATGAAPFNPKSIASVEFHVCYGMKGGDESYFHVPVDDGVQGALREMLTDTLKTLMPDGDVSALEEFEPAQKYGAEERLRVSLDKDYLEQVKNLFDITNIQTNPNVLTEVEDLSYYFVVFRDSAGRRLLAVRRAAQFKGIVKARLVRLFDNSLQLESDNVFKLDFNFDYVVFDGQVLILRPSGFEFTANLGAEVLAAAAPNAEFIAQKLSFLGVEGLAVFASSHKRAARLLAAIASRNDLAQTNKALLVKACKAQGVELEKVDGKFWPKEGQEYDFLCVLDRRIFSTSLIRNTVESYEAPNRIRRNRA